MSKLVFASFALLLSGVALSDNDVLRTHIKVNDETPASSFFHVMDRVNPVSKIKSCMIQTRQFLYYDGVARTAVKLIITQDHLYVGTTSPINPEALNVGIGIGVGYSAVIPYDHIIDKTHVRFTNFTFNHLNTLLRNKSIDIVLAYWPSAAPKERVKVTINLAGFDKVHKDFLVCVNKHYVNYQYVP